MKIRQLLNVEPENLEHRRFSGQNGEAEHFFAITAPGHLGFKEQVEFIETNYQAKMESLGLSRDTAVFRRIFLSDELNQIGILRTSQLAFPGHDHPVAVSMIQQPPLPCSKIALLAYHIESPKPLSIQRLSPSHLLIRKNRLGHLWSTNLCTKDTEKSLSAGAQTKSVFTDLINGLTLAGGDLYENCIRTWIYVRDIDVFYQGMVEARRDLFEGQGLTGNTHFIASTGIEGSCADRHDVVMMDAYSILGLKEGQVSYLNNYSMLCPAKKYNITFERGTRVSYADRSHYFISGTASIDNHGNILYPGNVLKQLERTLQNISSLLKAGDAGLEDMMYMIVYLRDPADVNSVKAELSKHLGPLPTIYVQGAVCRPEALIEIEGVAVKKQNQPSYPLF